MFFHIMFLILFCLTCLASLVFVILLGIVLMARRAGKGAETPSQMVAFLILAFVGTCLSTMGDYWRVFGIPPHHPDLPFLLSLCTIALEAMGFWVARKHLNRMTKTFVAANGGTASAALANALRHPGQSMTRMTERAQEQNSQGRNA